MLCGFYIIIMHVVCTLRERKNHLDLCETPYDFFSTALLEAGSPVRYANSTSVSIKNLQVAEGEGVETGGGEK